MPLMSQARCCHLTGKGCSLKIVTMLRVMLHVLIGLAYLIMFLFPLPECFVSRPDCPKRQKGPCQLINLQSSGKSDSCAIISCHRQRAGGTHQLVKKNHVKTSESRPMLNRLTIRALIKSDVTYSLPSVIDTSFGYQSPEFNTAVQVVSSLVPDRHPRDGPIILCKQSFLI